MKKIVFVLFMIYGLGLSAQKTDYDWKNMDPKQRKEIINSLSPDERKELLNTFRNNMVMDNLKIDPSNKDKFTQVYNEYLESQKQIKKQFDSNFNPEKMSDEEAKAKLQQSFDVGQKLLDNRKKYANKMQEIIPCQKVLKLFQSEKMMKDKMEERRLHENHQSSSKQKHNP